jgi:hypothetical protein
MLVDPGEQRLSSCGFGHSFVIAAGASNVTYLATGR